MFHGPSPRFAAHPAAITQGRLKDRIGHVKPATLSQSLIETQWTKRATTSRYERDTFTCDPEPSTRKHSPLVCGLTCLT